MLALGGSMQPHMGWCKSLLTAVSMFAVLVQVDQRLAAASVFLVSFSSALLARAGPAFLLAAAASWMTLLNARRRVCAPSPEFLEFQYQGYQGYHQRSEVRFDDATALGGKGSGNRFFACHPHGILSVGFCSNVVWGRKFHEVVGHCNYLIDPTLRNKGLLAKFFLDAFEGPHGAIRDTRAATIQELMEKGESISMTPGAYQEATCFSHGLERVALRQRKGFVKYCLRYGYRLHPVYTFGESETYFTLGGFEKLRLWLNGKGIPTVCFWGLPWCPLLPRRHLKLLTFVGPALELPKLPEPTTEQVDEWHQKYVEALRELFDRHKAEAGKPSAVLEIL
ncbi:dgat2 [Symbiodinium sp. CCMP2456]|nr:dgat2 [Symbiodinium sp. CCMP2456]